MYTTREYREKLKAGLEETIAKVSSLEAARKRQRGMAYYVPNAVQYRAHQSKARTILLCGANRIGKCLGEETLIYDPVIGKEIPVGKIKSDFHVLAWDGTGLRITKAENPFRKEVDKLYKVKLSNGGEFTASMSHVVLTPSGFRTISDVQVGGELFQPQTILESSRLVHGEDAPNCYQKSQDSQYDYRSLFRLCDGLLQREEGNVRDVSPSLIDAQAHISSLGVSYMGDLDNKPANILYCQTSCPPSSLGVQILNVDQPCDTVSGTSCTTSISAGVSNLVVKQPDRGSTLQQQVSSVSRHPNFFDSNHPFKSSCVFITSIDYVRNDYKYDFTVPVYHNYYASGAVHHNSTFGVMELCYHLTKDYPDWYPQERRMKGPIRAAISVTRFDNISGVIEPKIAAYLPRDYYRIKRKQTYMSTIECRDGSTAHVLTLEMDDNAYESADWDFVWEDEPQDQRKREGLIRGLVDRRGLEVITFTPLTEAWMKEELIDKADGKRIECFFAQMRDNKFDISGTPILSEESIKEFEESLPEEIREIRVNGQFFTLRGRVYREFSDVHQRDFKYQYPDPVICVLDPHDRKPHHVIWAFIDRNDDIYIDSEMVVHCELDDLAKKIKSHEQTFGYKMRKRLIDPNFGLKPAKPGANWCVKDELTRHGTGFYPANDDIDLRHHLVRDLLHYDRNKELTAINSPKLFFSKERCPQTIRSMRNLQYDEWSAATRIKRDIKEQEQDKDSDGADCVGYLAVSRPRFRVAQAFSEENYELEGAVY